MALTPFELVFETGSPVTLRRHALHLDGLLSALCFRHTGCPEKALGMLKELLLWNEHGFYHASAMAFGVTPEQTITAQTRHSVGRMRHGTLLHESLLAPIKINRHGENVYRKVNINGGPERNRLNRWNACHAPYLVFHGVGDVDHIGALTAFYCSRVGVNSNAGSGTVQGVYARAIDDDLSCIDGGGGVARNLPVSWFNDNGINIPVARTRYLPVTAPYWSNHNACKAVEAVPVEKIRRVIFSDR
ncbi:hypothetical protein GCM10023116_08730 [Kistimonas scapharcae]|uniref:Uncharacterized protein n=1 Tax=Kistimonas scapharcae TaxID=1036133 RepID=A0ABP8UZ40_9GAMM